MSTVARGLLQAAAWLLLVVAAGLLLAVTAGPRLLGYRTATMLTGSMSPTIRPGDVVIDTPEPAASVRVGQIITYHVPTQDHRVESHRVVWVGRSADGAVLVRTRGDANAVDDPWTARLAGSTVWRVRTVVPVAGSVIRTLRLPLVHVLMTGALPAALVAGLLVAIWRPAPVSGTADAAAGRSGSASGGRRPCTGRRTRSRPGRRPPTACPPATPGSRSGTSAAS
ncbi:MAG: signal peptidase I [Jatrophihabitans sp.]|nr:MAG: signal peptidase I [Jatrophihabitans sp.]